MLAAAPPGPEEVKDDAKVNQVGPSNRPGPENRVRDLQRAYSHSSTRSGVQLCLDIQIVLDHVMRGKYSPSHEDREHTSSCQKEAKKMLESREFTLQKSKRSGRYSRWDIPGRTPKNIPESSKLPSSLRASEVPGTAFNSTGRSTDRQKRGSAHGANNRKKYGWKMSCFTGRLETHAGAVRRLKKTKTSLAIKMHTERWD